MNRLVENIVNELKLQIFSEENIGDKKVIAIYPGRFQPMGLHHKAAYDWLAKQFGKENTYIVTSDKVDASKSPFTFQEKKKIINKHGIKNVAQVKMPYHPVELLEKFDPKTTVIVYMIGEKDTGRLSSYKRLMKYNKTTLIPYKDIDNPYAYYVYAPHISYSIPDFGEMSGTSIRNALGDTQAKLAQLKERFQSIMGWFDADIFNFVINKLNKSNRGTLQRRGKLKEDLNEWMKALLNMTEIQSQLFFTTIKKEYGDTKDLLPIIRKFIKTGKLTDDEKKTFRKQMRDNMKLLGLGAIAAIPLPGTMLIIPVIIELAKKFNINLLPESKQASGERLNIVRREFWDKVFEEVLKEDSLIMEGGAAGHMTHPFEDMGLTFGDMKEMFRLGLSGEITSKGSPSEKLDGQNLFVTYKDGKLYAARNKGDLKTGGMDYDAIKLKFKDRGEIEKAFTFAFEDLESAIGRLTNDQQDRIFKGGTIWMNLEILYPGSANVINYDGAYIVFHGSTEYGENGEKIASYPESASILAGMIKQVNADTQKTFSISKPKNIIVNRSERFDEELDDLTTKLNDLQKAMDCTDKDTLGLWHQRWWERYIDVQTDKLGIVISEDVKKKLVKRWAFNDKSFALNAKNLPDQKLFYWAREIDKSMVEEQLKKNIRPFESLVLKFGAEVLKNVQTVMSLDPEKTKEKLKTDIADAVQTLSKSTDVKDLNVLKTQLQRIQAAGGIDAISPLEGIVFTFNGKTYKLTGTFAPINQLLGYFKFK